MNRLQVLLSISTCCPTARKAATSVRRTTARFCPCSCPLRSLGPPSSARPPWWGSAWCGFNPGSPQVDRACFQRLKLLYDQRHSTGVVQVEPRCLTALGFRSWHYKHDKMLSNAVALWLQFDAWTLQHGRGAESCAGPGVRVRRQGRGRVPEGVHDARAV